MTGNLEGHNEPVEEDAFKVQDCEMKKFVLLTSP